MKQLLQTLLQRKSIVVGLHICSLLMKQALINFTGSNTLRIGDDAACSVTNLALGLQELLGAVGELIRRREGATVASDVLAQQAVHFERAAELDVREGDLLHNVFEEGRAAEDPPKTIRSMHRAELSKAGDCVVFVRVSNAQHAATLAHDFLIA
jgi:hypothetical protein